MLEKADIVRNLRQARELRLLRDRMVTQISGMSKEERHEFMMLYQVQMGYYDVIVDDLIVMGAFEMYAKAMLLARQRIPHLVTKPNQLSKLQKKHPLHMRTYRSQLRKGKLVSLSPNTLTASTLLHPNYQAVIGLPRSTFAELSKINKRRNLVHFHLALSWDLPIEAIEAIETLRDAIDIRA